MKEFESIVGADNVKYNEPMSKHTSFKVGGNADVYITADSIEKVKEIVKLAKEKNMPITVIGNGTNLLVSDDGIRGITLKYNANKISIIDDVDIVELDGNKCNADEKICIADGGATNGIIAMKLLENELSGFEFAAGIPGTIAGAVYMNAGAFGGEMKDIVEYTKYIDMNTVELCTINNEQHNFEYRSSVFKNKDAIIVEVGMKLHKSNKDDIQKKMNECREKRMSSQPLDKPSAGSTFKRGEDFITAKLIDEAGLKGYSIGGAEVSTKHAGFIVNKGNATAKDIMDLIEYVKETVFDKFNKRIEMEVRIIK